MSKSLPFLGCILLSISTFLLLSSYTLSSCCLFISSASLSSLFFLNSYALFLANQARGSDSALDIKGCVFSLLGPHFRREVVFVWLYHFVFSRVHVQACDFTFLPKTYIHLGAHFSHHNCRFSFVFISLHHSFVLLRMVVSLLIGLCECVVESLPGSVVSVTAEIRFHLIGFGHLDVHSFYLIILHSNFYFELVWHDEFVSLDGVKVMLLLVLLPHLLSVLLLLLHFICCCAYYCY